MASTYTAAGIELIAQGEQAGAWGNTTNTNWQLIEEMVGGVVDISLTGATYSLSTSDGASSEGRHAVLNLAGSPGATCTITVTPNDMQKIYFVINGSDETVTFTQGSGANVSISAGKNKIIYCDGAGASAAVTDITNNLDSMVNTSGDTMTGVLAFDGETSNTAYLRVDTDVTAHPSHTAGNVFWCPEQKAVTYHNDISGVSLQIGMEEWIRVKNITGSTIANGTPVYATGQSGGITTVAPADATTEEKARVLGLATESIANNAEGVITCRGLINDIDTSALAAGQPVHVGADGSLQTAAPTYPYWACDVGGCVVSDASTGQIYVRITEHHQETLRVSGNSHLDGNLTIEGDLSVTGTQSITSQSNLSVDNSFVYLNSGDTIGSANTTFTGSGLDDGVLTGHYKGSSTIHYYVRIDSVGGGTGGVDTFEWSKDNFSTTEATDVDIDTDGVLLDNNVSITFNASTGHTLNDKWDGEASPVNVDTGFFTNRNTGASGVGYTHAGVFFDVSDQKWKAVEEYDPEPEGTINIGHASFNLGTFVADTFEGALTGNVTGNVTGDVTGAVTGNASTATALQTARSIGISLSGDVTGSGSASFDGTGNVTITASNMAVQANSVALGTDTTGNYVGTVSAGSGITVSGADGEGATKTVAHADTSSQASVNNSGNTFIQDITLDTYGHITGIVSNTAVINDGTLTMQTSGTGLSGSASFTANDSDNVTFTVTSNATNANTGSTIVARDASGNFSAGTITAALSGNASTATKLATSRTLSITGDANGSASFDGSANASISVSLAANSVAASEIAANAVGASELNVSGNGTTSQFLRSDGDGTFTWATPTDTNTTYSAGAGLNLSGTTFSLESDARGDLYYIGRGTNDYYGVETTQHNWYLDGNLDMRLENDGDLHVDGDVIAYSTTTSDPRLKDDVAVVDNALEKLNKLTGYTFTYKADGRESAGVMSTEVKEVLPSAVRSTTLPLKSPNGEDDTTEYDVVQYDQLHAILIEAVKELTKRVEELEAK